MCTMYMQQSSTVLNWCVVQHLHIDCAAPKRADGTAEVLWVVLRKDRTLQKSVQLLSLSTGLERMSTPIFSPKELRSFHMCNNSLPKSWNCPLHVLCCIFWDKSRWNTMYFFCWYNFGEALLPLHRRGELYAWFLELLRWFKVILVPFFTVGISPVAHPHAA